VLAREDGCDGDLATADAQPDGLLGSVERRKPHEKVSRAAHLPLDL